MKFVLAILFFLLLTAFMSWGIVLLMHGKPMLLLVTLGIFVGLFSKYGCLSH